MASRNPFSALSFTLNNVRRRALLACGCLCAAALAWQFAATRAASGTPVSLTALNVSVSENFNTLANTGTASTVPNGWGFAETGTNANTTYTAGTGSSTTGDTYSFGAAGNTERAFGGLQSSSLVPTVGGCFINNTGQTITSLNISYFGEQWRLGATGRNDRLDFQYSTNASSLTTGTYTDFDALDFVAPISTGATGALDGNAAANRVNVAATISGLSIANGATFFIRWNSFDATGSDDGLGIDDFTLTPQGAPLCATIAVTPTSVPSGIAGTAYGPVNFMQSGGFGAIAWSVSSNNLPAGLMLNAMTGVLSGTPSVAAGVNVTIRATDANSCFGETTVTLQINCPTIGIAPSTGALTTLTGGTLGQMYNQTFTAAPVGGNYTYSIPMAALPPGLSFNTATGVLSGTPTMPGTFNFTVTATGFGACTGSQNYALTIACSTVTLAPTTLPGGTYNVAYVTQTLTASGTGLTGAFTFTLQAGSSLPLGLTLSLAGELSGTPTQPGGFTFTVIATNTATNCAGNRTYTIGIQCPTINIAPTTLPQPIVGVLYNQPLTGSGGVGPYTFALANGSSLPPGLSLSSGAITGTPSQTGTFTFTINVTDTMLAAGQTNCGGNRTYTVTVINNCPSVFTVNNLGEAVDANPGDRVCATAAGDCTLRAAIMEANAIPVCSPLTINFSVTGTINLADALPNLAHPDLTINGPTSAPGITVRRNSGGSYSVFTINGGRNVTINNLTITNGNTDNGGGILNTGNLTLNGSTLTGNTATSAGGGLFDAGGTTLIVNSTISGNTAPNGAGIEAVNTAFNPTTTLRFATITNNTATGLGGGLESGTAHPVTISNTLIAGNSAAGGPEIRNFGTLTSQGNNLIRDNSGATITNQMASDLVGSSGAPINPLLAALGSYGGPTQTHALLPGSPALNAGSNTGAPATDQRGIARPQQSTTDIGAFESRGFTLAVSGGNGQSAFVNTAFANPLTATVTAIGAGEPVNGGQVTFTPPGSGASATLANSPATIANGQASVTATANGTVGGPYNVAASANGATPAVNFALTNTNPPPAINGATIARQQGSPAANAAIATVSDPNQAAGTLTVAATTVPAGITVTNLVNTNGAITADVAAACTAAISANTVVLTVTDSLGATATANLIVNVTANTPPVLIYPSPQSVPAGGSLSVAPTTATDNGAVNNTYRIVDVTPALNTAPTVNASGVVAITNAGPAGSHVITIRVTDNCGATTDAQFTVNVTCPAINATVTGGGAICPGGSATVTVTLTGGTAPYTVTLNNGGGTLTGNSPLVFTVNPAATTIYAVQTATDANGCAVTATGSATVTVNTATAITTQPVSLIRTIGQSATFSVVAAGTNLTFQWRRNGVNISAPPTSSITISPVLPEDAGSYDVVVTGTCGTVTSSAATLTINCQTITITNASLPVATAGAPYNATLTQTGAIGNLTWRLASGTLPANLSLNAATGVISGTPAAAGSANLTFKVTDVNNCMATASFTLTVNPPPCNIALNPAALPVGMKGSAYSATFTATNPNGAVSFARTAGALPPGLTLNSGGVLSGTPTTAGSFDFTITATDANNCAASRNYTLVIGAQTGSIGDPLICLGPGGIVDVEATVTNGGVAAQSVIFTATPDATLRVLANTCVVNTGACAIDTQNNRVNWNGALTANQTVTIRYQAQVADSAVPGQQLCVNSVALVNGAGPFAVQACTRVTCPPAGPGASSPALSPISDQKAGSVLMFNLYTSSASGATIQNTRLALTNTDALRTAYVHLFFVDGATCSIADSMICLTPNQTSSFMASDIDPGTTGYLIAVATDRLGCPISFNHLIGDEFVKLNSGHAANLAAEAVAAIPGGFAPCDPLAAAVELRFDNVMYDALPRVLALSNIASRADGNNTLLVVNRIGGNLATGASTLVNVFGVLYDDAETPFSFSFSPGLCQFRSLVSSSFPRTTPRFEQAIPAGRSGWLKLGMQTEGALSGAALNFNANAATTSHAFNQGHNLHKLTLTEATTVTVPVFPPSC